MVKITGLHEDNGMLLTLKNHICFKNLIFVGCNLVIQCIRELLISHKLKCAVNCYGQSDFGYFQMALKIYTCV